MFEEKRAMSRTLVVIIVLVILAVVAYAIFSPSSGNGTGSAVQNQQTTASNSNMVKLSDSQYANYAYLISGDTLSQQAQTATTGFNIEKTSNADGSTTYDLVATNPEYQSQTYTIQPGQSLYFLEGSLGDDSGGEHMLGDDMAIVVDSNGYIVSGPGPA